MTDELVMQLLDVLNIARRNQENQSVLAIVQLLNANGIGLNFCKSGVQWHRLINQKCKANYEQSDNEQERGVVFKIDAATTTRS